jgi:hypothetical protein
MHTPTRGCATCRFSEKIRPNPGILQSVLVCKWGPPIFQMRVLPDGSALPGFGPVPCPSTDYFCHRFEPVALDAANS